MATISNPNAKVRVGNGLGPKTTIVKVAKTDITQDELDTMKEALETGGTFSGVTNDAFTIAGVASDGGDALSAPEFEAGASDVVFFALQGTGTINADASNALGVTGAALTIESIFEDNA